MALPNEFSPRSLLTAAGRFVGTSCLIIFSVAVALTVGCGDDSAGSADASVDGNPVPDATLDATPDRADADANLPSCIDDMIAGTEAAPADLTVQDGTDSLTVCPAVNDYFSIEAMEGALLRIDMEILGADPSDPNDLDLVLYAGIVDANNVVARSDGTEATEQIIFAVETAGTYILEIGGFMGATSPYTLTFQQGEACANDADCDTAGEFCQYTVVDAQIGIECAPFMAPGCGMGPEDATASYSDSTAFAYTAPIADAMLCRGDIDVYSVMLERGDSLVGTLTATLPMNQAMVAIIRNAAGELLGTGAITNTSSTSIFSADFVNEAGLYYVYIVDGGLAALPDTTYSLELDVAEPCYLDSDCSDGDVCYRPPNGETSAPDSMCRPYVADVCTDNDDDNSFANATEITAGGPVTGQVVCPSTSDFYRFELDSPTDVTIQVSWATGDDIDVYLFAPDGTFYGGGFFGMGTENLTGGALPAGTYHVLVSFFASADPMMPAGDVPYSIQLTTTPGVCANMTDCVVGGTFDDGMNSDATIDLICDGGSCIRPSPIEPPFSVDTGGACFQGSLGPSECRSSACIQNTCVDFCPGGSQMECDTAFGAPNISYCDSTTFTAALCLPTCGGGGAWTEAECMGIFGATATCNAMNRCMP
ncbi:MAG: PPC domain-containing protein [Myxococcota bacterium]